MNDQVNIVIFSCDRACQLQACIESLKKNFHSKEEPSVTIIYKATAPKFQKSYEKLKETFPETDKFVWKQETNFKKQTEAAVNETTSQYTMFLVDDVMLVNYVSTDDQQFSMVRNNPMLLGASLRLHSGINQCYATDSPVTVPNFVKGMVWTWAQQQGDWGYPMSVDGNVYNTDFIKTFMATLNFSNPNTFEAALDTKARQTPVPAYLCCYPDAPRIINIPANRVQHVFQNRYAKGYTAEELNNLYLEGRTIDIEQYQGKKFNTVHVPIELKFR